MFATSSILSATILLDGDWDGLLSERDVSEREGGGMVTFTVSAVVWVFVHRDKIVGGGLVSGGERCGETGAVEVLVEMWPAHMITSCSFPHAVSRWARCH